MARVRFMRNFVLCLCACMAAMLLVGNAAENADGVAEDVIPYSWEPYTFDGGGCIQGIAFSPHEKNLAYSFCDVGGVFKSIDGGKNWRAINKGLLEDNANLQVCSLVLDPVKKGVIYILTGTAYTPKRGGVFKSVDGGESWRLLTRKIWSAGNGRNRTWGRLLVIDPKDSQTVYAGSVEDGLFVSHDAGISWENIGLSGKHIESVLLTGNADIGLLVACKGEGVFALDGSGKWLSPQVGFNALELAQAPGDANMIFAAASKDGIFRSLDGGISWEKVSNGLKEGANMADVICTRDGAVYAASMYSKERYVYRSDNLGDSWVVAPENISAIDKSGWLFEKAPWVGLSAVKCLADSPFDDEAVYAGDWHGVFRSMDKGKSWITLSKGLATLCIYSINVHPEVPENIYVGSLDMGLFISNDGAESFEHPDPVSSQFSMTWDETASIEFDPFSPNKGILSVCRDWVNPHDGGVAFTEDYGKTWQELARLPGNAAVLGVAYSKAVKGMVYALSEGKGLFVSRDYGKTWTVLSDGLTKEVGRFSYWSQASIHINPENENTMLIRQNHSNGVFRTIDGGLTWEKVRGIGHSACLEFDPHDPSIVYCGAYDGGIRRSTDGGRTWETLFPKKPGRVSCVSIKCDPVSPGILYACFSASMKGNNAYVGIYKSVNAGMTWQKLGDTGIQHDVYLCMDVDFDSGKIYVGTNGGGMFIGTKMK